MPKGYSPSRNNWTPDEVLRVEERIRRGWSDEKIGRSLGRTATAVKICRKRRRLGSVTSHTMTGHAVARTLGRDPSVISDWCKRGWLPARRSVRRGGTRQWLIEEEGLLMFLANPEMWMLWRPEDITALWMREWAAALPRYRWLSPGEVGERFAVGHGAVNAWIHAGLLPAVRRGNHWIPEPALERFVPPCEHGKQGMRITRWSNAEDSDLLRLRSGGATLHAIGKTLGRSVGSVASRWYRLRDEHPEVLA